VLAAFYRKLYLRGRFRAAGVAYTALGWTPLGAFAIALCLCSWPVTLARWIGRAPSILGWPHPSTLFALAPFVVYSLLAIDARARVSESRRGEIGRARRFHTRLFFAALAPFVLFLGLTWLVGIDRGVRANIEHVGLWGGVFAATMLALSGLLLPWLLRNTWDATPMPRNPTRELLESFAEHVRFRCRDLLVWNTGHQMANAAVVGVGARQRFVLFSDALLLQLPPRELIAVFAHEIGHVARHHVLAFLAWGIALFLGLDLALTLFDPLSDLWLWGALGIALALWYVGFGFLSRRAELEADLFAIQLTGDLPAMTHALELVGSPHTRGIGSWRHFSTERRIAFLRRATEHPAIARRLTRTLRAAAWIGVALAGLVLLLELRELARAYPRDRVTVALALGDYEASRARLSELGDADTDLSRRVELGARLYADGRTDDVERLTRTALEALPIGDRELAEDCLELARLRGREGLQPALEQLDEGASNGEVFVTLDRALRTGSR
jgi:Zn-dependent protease with chaperone function